MKPNQHNKKIGSIGEKIAARFLVKKGHKIICRNYLKPCGELDIIAEKKGILHFVEVKTVSCENLEEVARGRDSYRPEDNLHPWKLSRLSRTIQVYLSEHELSGDSDWVFDVVVVYLNIKFKKARVSLINEVVL